MKRSPTADLNRGFGIAYFDIRPNGDSDPFVDERSLAEFLASSVASSDLLGEITVRSIIRISTVAFGGVHFMRLTNPDEQQLADGISRLGGKDDDLEALISIIRDISIVTLRALT